MLLCNFIFHFIFCTMYSLPKLLLFPCRCRLLNFYKTYFRKNLSITTSYITSHFPWSRQNSYFLRTINCAYNVNLCITAPFIYPTDEFCSFIGFQFCHNQLSSLNVVTSLLARFPYFTLLRHSQQAVNLIGCERTCRQVTCAVA